MFKFLISCRRCLARVLTLYINTALLVPLSVSINNMLCVFRPAQRGTATLHLSTTTTSPNRPARRSMKSSVTASQTEGPCRKETSSTVRASQFYLTRPNKPSFDLPLKLETALASEMSKSSPWKCRAAILSTRAEEGFDSRVASIGGSVLKRCRQEFGRF